MTNYREILRLASLGLSQQNIADSSGVSKKTVNRVLKRARELDIFWPLEPDETDAVLADKLFPSTLKQVSSTKRMPDFDYIRKELLHNGVTRSSSGRNTWRNAASPAMNLLCIPSSASTSRRMKKNAGQRCTSIESPANRSKSTGPEILLRSQIRTPERSSLLSSL